MNAPRQPRNPRHVRKMPARRMVSGTEKKALVSTAPKIVFWCRMAAEVPTTLSPMHWREAEDYFVTEKSSVRSRWEEKKIMSSGKSSDLSK